MKLATSILIVLFPLAAVGQTTLSNPQHPLTREPEPSDRQSCDLLYPPAEKSAGTEGVTVLSVRIATNGTASEASVAQSSGDSDLDKAAVACVKGSHVGRVKQDGKPIEVTWQRQVAWRAHDSSKITIPRVSAKTEQCSHPFPAFHTRGSVSTDVSFHIEPDGGVRDIVVLKSSGNPQLDGLATDCIVSNWRYPPAMQDGKPVQIDMVTFVHWKL